MIISIKVKSRARQRSVSLEGDGSLVVHTTKARENGQANDDVVDILAEHYSVPKSCITIKSGHRSARKIIEILA